jgi:integrase
MSEETKKRSKGREHATGCVTSNCGVHASDNEERLGGCRIKIYWDDEQIEIVRSCHSEVDQTEDRFGRFLEQKADQVPIARAELTLGDAAKNVHRVAELNGRPPSRAYDNHLIPFFGRHTKMSMIAAAWIKQFIEHQLEAGAANATVNRQLEALRRAFTVAIQDELLASKPYIPRLREDNVRTGFFDRKQFEALRQHLPRPCREPLTEAEIAADPLIAITEFGWITGWRLGEVRGLRWKNVDSVNGVVRLEPGTTKNGEGREFPMTRSLRAVLERRFAVAQAERPLYLDVDPESLVFRKRGGKDVGDFRKTWHRACRQAGVPDRVVRKASRTGKIVERRLPGLTFHDFRRTAVRRLVEEAGVSERVAMTMTGHKTRSVFDRYHIVSLRDRREAARRLDELDIAAGREQQ